ncbi:MAG: PilZ domain-containing protein [Zavarzinella sp.]|nr:PilZ domain-containing protein [Zavarzinella sp.]
MPPPPATPDSKAPDNVTGPAAPSRRWRNRVPRSGVRAEVRAGTSGLGPNLAAGLVNLGEGGAAVLMTARALLGEEVDVVLLLPSGVPLRIAANVRWCHSAGGGRFEAGLQFRRRLSPEELLDLCY